MFGELQHTSEKDLRLIDDDVEWSKARKKQVDQFRAVTANSSDQPHPDYYNFSQCVSAQGCNGIMQEFYHTGLNDTGRVGDGQIHTNIRTADLYYHENKKIITLLQDAFDDVNKERFWDFNIELIEPPHMCVYHGTNSGHYTWHMDWKNVSDFRRVISMSMLLNDGSEFEGGELELFHGLDSEGKPICSTPQLQKAGDICFFKSNITHRVKPVTLGTRVALVAWAWGTWGNKKLSK